MALRSWLDGGSRNDDERATTARARTLVSAEAISSVIPPAKKSCAASPELFSSGSTAIVGVGAGACAIGVCAAGACAPADESAAPSMNAVTPAIPKHGLIRLSRNL